jgi:cyclopropane-fatty-acyl-phospholipid synthase
MVALVKPDRKVEGLRRIIEHIARNISADLSVRLWDGTIVPLGPNVRGDLAFALRSPAAIRRLMLSPKTETFLELFAAGELDVENGSLLEAARCVNHVRVLHLARKLDRRMVLRALWPFLFAGKPRAAIAVEGYRPAKAGRRQIGRDDKRLIEFHYDVSNDFYALFLGRDMVYSCAWFERPDMTLDEAQRAKLDMICRRLRLTPGERFLDLGCGWGALICHAARNYGVTALGVTLSQQQFDFCREKISRLGLSDRVAVELCDYRTVSAGHPFDKVAQIELYEHIGAENHDRHFAFVHSLLRPRGLYLHHSVTRRLTRNPRKLLRTAGYQKFLGGFVLPGTALDDIGATLMKLERNGFEVHDVENWREHFLKTAELWERGLRNNREAAESEVGVAKTRLWLTFFSVFALAFERNACLVFQTLASRRAVGPSGLPPTRADLYEA